MAAHNRNQNRPWRAFYGPNLGIVHELYEQYETDPDSVDEDIRSLFERWGAPPGWQDTGGAEEDVEQDITTTHTGKLQGAVLRKAVAADELAQNIRRYGHLAANINPLEDVAQSPRLLDPKAYGLSENDLRVIPADIIWADAPPGVDTAWDAIQRLKQIHTQSLAYEFDHVYDVKERNWLNHMVENRIFNHSISADQRIALLERLTEVEGFERFLHRTFVGQKRFSIEGLDMLVPMIDEIVREGAHKGIRSFMIGMAHRGRLNVLAHNLGKPYAAIFSEFHHAPNKELVPSEGSMGINYGWTGDVKYHLGADRQLEEVNEIRAHLTLANNPSHLEFVNPVVQGFTRAAQENRDQAGFPVQDVTRAMSILIHGDAAFPGEGIVAETLNLSRLPGFQTGGSIHIIANNQLGFTTESEDSRSTEYASDLAKGFEIPIVHVNADDPEACLAAVRLALEYRRRFQKDFLIDLCGYRRYGHNEMDDPFVTQAALYAKIEQHPTVRTLYAHSLQSTGVVTKEQVDQMEKEVQQRLETAYEEMKTKEKQAQSKKNNGGVLPPNHVSAEINDIQTSVPIEVLQEMNAHLLQSPEGFTIYPKLKRILERRKHALQDGGRVDWGLAETLAFATILADGKSIRLTGQDTQRGTFAHRHLMLHDPETGKSYSPLHILPQAKASFSIFNSPLSEASVLGFEYGYDFITEDTLTVWEAQYGDFANAAQVIIDQFISAGRAKWGQRCSLVMLLPHGYEGQGPEHSSARLERYLQLAAENNCFVANLTSAAQYFHLLRRQAAIVDDEQARPLILMSPKSLIRNRRTASPGTDFSEGKFRPVLEEPALGQQPERVRRLILCSGKIAIDLQSELETNKAANDTLHIVRIEQLYPFPEKEVTQIIHRFDHLQEVVWVQEEPRNMGAWSYIEPRLKNIVSGRLPVRYVGRPERSSPAEGLPDIHEVEQGRILEEALNIRQANQVTNAGGSPW